MHILLLGLLIGIFTILSVFAIVNFFCEHYDKIVSNFKGCLIILVNIFFVTWFIGAVTRTPKIDKVQVVSVHEIKNEKGTIQLFTYHNGEKYITLSVMDKFGLYVQPETKIKVIILKLWPYCGVSFHGFHNHKFEIE